MSIARVPFLVALFLVNSLGSLSASAQFIPDGEVFGAVELIPGLRANNCQFLVSGIPTAGACDGNGEYDVRGVIIGRAQIRITVVVPGTGEELTQTLDFVPSNPGEISMARTAVMSQPITIGGRIAGITNANSNLYYVSIDDDRNRIDQGFRVTAATLTDTGAFFLYGLAPGRHDLQLRAYGQQAAVASMIIDVFASHALDFFAGLSVSPVPSVPPGINRGP